MQNPIEVIYFGEVLPKEYKQYNNRYYNLRNKMTKLARSTAPVDTGNLKQNGIYSMSTPKGFRIVWDKRYAYYIEIVDKGQYKTQTAKIMKNMGFVSRGMVKALVPIRQLQDGDKSSFKGAGKSNLKYALPSFMTGKVSDKMLKRLYKSIDQSEEDFPIWDFENVEQNDIKEYDET